MGYQRKYQISQVAPKYTLKDRRSAFRNAEIFVFCIFTVSPLVISIIIYGISRGNPSVLENLQLESLHTKIITQMILEKGCNMIAYNLPDGLWSLSFCSTMMLIWSREIFLVRAFVYVASIIFCISFETLQYLFIVPGTYDPLDIVFMLILGLGAWVMWSVLNSRRRNTLESQ